jgi:hypothetical protein
MDRVSVSDGCWLWLGSRMTVKQYGRVAGPPGLLPRTWYAHRLAYHLFCGPIPPGLLVLHRCDNPSCVRPDHLFLGTNEANQDDKARKGRAVRYKLTPEQIPRIRRLLEADDLTISEIARQFSVTRGVIYKIRAGEIWRYC